MPTVREPSVPHGTTTRTLPKQTVTFMLRGQWSSPLTHHLGEVVFSWTHTSLQHESVTSGSYSNPQTLAVECSRNRKNKQHIFLKLTKNWLKTVETYRKDVQTSNHINHQLLEMQKAATSLTFCYRSWKMSVSVRIWHASRKEYGPTTIVKHR